MRIINLGSKHRSPSQEVTVELTILEWIQVLRNPILDVFFSIYTRLGDTGEIWFLVMIVTAFNKKTRYMSLLALCAILIEVVSVEGILKPIFMRQRPFEVHQIDLLIGHPHGSSFPSGHSASSFAVAGIYFFKNFKYKWVLMFMAALMAFSRLYHFVHYPSDVLVGSIIGMLIAYIIVKVSNKVFKI